VLCAKRVVFLDDKNNVKYIEHQLNIALKILEKKDSVVAIGHCRIDTYRALKIMSAKLKPYLVNVEYVINDTRLRYLLRRYICFLLQK